MIIWKLALPRENRRFNPSSNEIRNEFAARTFQFLNNETQRNERFMNCRISEVLAKHRPGEFNFKNGKSWKTKKIEFPRVFHSLFLSPSENFQETKTSEGPLHSSQLFALYLKQLKTFASKCLLFAQVKRVVKSKQSPNFNFGLLMWRLI